MSELLRRVDGRTVVTVVVLDLVTYAAVYWFIVPALETVLAALPGATVLAVGVTLAVVRLTLVGLFAARSLRARRGFDHRSDAVPSVLVGAVAAMLLQLALGLAASVVTGTDLAIGSLLVSMAEWIVFPLVGLVFVTPGPADSFSRPRGVPVR